MANPFIQYKYDCNTSEILSQYVQNKGLLAAYEYVEAHGVNTGLRYEFLITFKDIYEAIALLKPIADLTFCREWKTIMLGKGDLKFILEISWGKEYPYNKLSVQCWSKLEEVEAVEKLLKDAIRAHFVKSEDHQTLVTVNWFSRSREGGVTSRNVNTIITETVHPEAYPYLNLDAFVSEYLVAAAPVLLLTGTQGTGKTRLIRHIIKTYVEEMKGDKDNVVHEIDEDGYGPSKEDKTQVAYTTDAGALEEEDLYVSLRLGNYKFIVLEDIDFSLTTRKDGNDLMHKFLALSDGFMSSNCRIIFSTNLNLNEVDPALVRPGRCFAAIETRPLVTEEAAALVNVLTDTPIVLEGKEYTVAEVYNAVSPTSITAKSVKIPAYPQVRSCRGLASRRVGFGKG